MGRVPYKVMLNKKEIELIDKMFFGPYENKWLDEDGMAINGTDIIAKRLNLTRSAVDYYVNLKLNKKIEKVNSKYPFNPNKPF